LQAPRQGALQKEFFDQLPTPIAFLSLPETKRSKTGEAEYDTYYVDNVVAKIDSGVGTGTIVDETGITRNVKGEGPFHDISVRCLYHWSVVGETNHFNGSCVETDKDGDNVFVTFDDKNHYFMGGTGKYKGITGTAVYTLSCNFTTRSAAGRPLSSTTRLSGRSNKADCLLTSEPMPRC
jgi:hypothetical protein